MTTVARHKDFGSPVSVKELDPVAFTLYGEEFTCHPDIQGRALVRFIAKVDSDNNGQAAEAVLDIFKVILPEESYERFDALVSDNSRIVPIETLVEIVNWVIETYTDRPTKQPTPSSGGRKKSGRTSAESASSAVA